MESLYTYDIHGRLLTENAGGEYTYYTYDNNGNQLTVSNAADTTTRTYDALNRVISKTVSGMGQTKYKYDVTSGMPSYCLGEVTTDPKGNVTTKIYDRAGRLSQVKVGSDTTAYTYYDNGSLNTVSYPNSVTAEYAYYANKRLHM